MRKLTFASIVSICMVPILFWSQDGSAIPSFARKYQTSCYTCHSGFPTRNSFGEAFKANGYRWPGGEDEDHAKQEQTKMGTDGWKKIFPMAPWPTDIPGFAPLAIWVTGPLVNYADEVKKNGVVTKQQVFNWGGPFDARILYGGTIGENIGFFGAVQGITTGTTTSSFRATWSFAPGVMLGVGNGFSFFSSGEDIGTYTNMFPSANGTGVEFSYAAGEKSGGINIYAGAVGAGTTAAVLGASKTTDRQTHLDDIRYFRAEYKFGGAGVLSGAGGTYGNDYNGLDNHLSVGASIVNGKPGAFKQLVSTSTFANEETVYGIDVTGTYGSFVGGAAWSRSHDMKLNNYGVDAGYYVYPWLFAKVAYRNIGDIIQNNPGKGEKTSSPNYTLSLTAWPRANVSVAASYKLFTKGFDPALNDKTTTANTFTLTTALAF